ncbi:hypothetical protein [Bradyrhizobium australiense]|uniref:Uncharacterized protein n=1 Tax=Bradyrhizobium australiense TaxID=2721161 RepID=A0A7Y4LY78_9BRAD|nr:hypothetical protein [Bradyrhizobium australiense]NOJ42450.1 hypothetical protein [Bradyrhizobium australiense]
MSGANLLRIPWSKIGAEPSRRVLRRTSVVNPMVFSRLLRINGAAGNFRHIRPVRAVRICDTPLRLSLRSNHFRRAVRPCGRSGLDIAKLVSEIAGLLGEWIADDRLAIFFSTTSVSAKWALRGSCSFWDSRLVRPVSFCDGGSSTSQPFPMVRYRRVGGLCQKAREDGRCFELIRAGARNTA